VNFKDYAVLANAWLSELGQPNYNADCDLHENGIVDFYDFAIFAIEWLWQGRSSTPLNSEIDMMMSMGGGAGC